MIKLNKVIIISPDIIDHKMAGPGIRYWNIANELSNYHSVVLFTPNNCGLTSSFTIKTINKKSIISECQDASCIILQGTSLWINSYIKKLNIPIVVDLYDPFLLENLELNYYDPNASQLHKSSLTVLLDQLLWGDFFICASEKQKDYWLGMLTAINRLNPYEYAIDKTLKHLITVVPFGLPASTPTSSTAVLKGVYPGINYRDKIILWGGGIWNWLDPLTAINSINILTKERNDIKLFFMGIKHPNPDINHMQMVDDAINLSYSLGLTEKNVYFNEWVNYEDRHNYLLDSDVGLSLHFNHMETRFSFRTRLLDYFWCRLPVITTSGDVMSDIVKKYGLGRVVPAEDPVELSKAIKSLLNEKHKFNFDDAIENLTWEKAVAPLLTYCESPYLSRGKAYRLNIEGLNTNKLYYYLIKSIALIKKGESKFLFQKIKNKLLKL
ncbi:MAG: glycosyltransferase family 4 protein [Firmicutes bacterium]|nr:glycosyltransferase family 4 protein [Bacillota bacterium]